MSPLTATEIAAAAAVGNEHLNDKLKLLKTSHWQRVGSYEEKWKGGKVESESVKDAAAAS